MCKKGDECEFEEDLKGCALKHIGEARKLISKGKFEDVDVELSYAEKHLKETQIRSKKLGRLLLHSSRSSIGDS
jgi:hypothetical protein